jgi:hypothetical protein
MTRFAWTVVVIAISLTVIVPLVTRLVHVLLVPASVGVVLYLAVRLVNAHLNRW